MARLMKEWTIDRFGASNLKLTERRVPEAGPGRCSFARPPCR